MILSVDGMKGKRVLEANTNQIHLLNPLVKGVICWDIISIERQADSNFLTGKAHKVMAELKSKINSHDNA